MRRGAVVGAIVVVAGCEGLIGLDDYVISNTADGGVDAGDAAAPGFDAGTPVTLPPVTCTGNSGACTALGLDAGWTPVAAAAGNAVCPSGFAAAVLAQTDPTATAGACGCNVEATVPPDCTSGKIAFRGSVSSCDVDADLIIASTPACRNALSALGNGVLAYDPPDAGAASCTAVAVSDATKVTASVVTLCAPTSCADTVCAAAPLGGLKACVMASGDVACPAKFTEKQIVGAEIQAVTCSDCTCAATNPGCTGQLLQFFEDAGCTGTPFYSEPPAVCVATTLTEFNSSLYTATGTATFTASGPMTATITLAEPKTVCCAP